MNIGIAGLGFMGAAHLGAYAALPQVRVAAYSARDPRVLAGDLSGIGGNLGRPSVAIDLSQTRKVADWKNLVDDPSLDVLDICLPTDLHKTVAIQALHAGKHVFCEKPMALSSADCGDMIEAATRSGRTLMIGQVLRFWPEYEVLRDFVKRGEHGSTRQATFVRRCGIPDWSKWLTDETRSGGAVLDLLVHDIDQILLCFGVPDRVSAKSMGGPDTVAATFLYSSGPEVRLQGGWFPAGTPFSMSYQLRADRAQLEMTADGVVLSDNLGRHEKIKLPEHDPYEREIAYFLDCCQTGATPDQCPPQESQKAVEIACLLRESRAREGEQLNARS